MIITDLDGTLLNDHKKVSDDDYNTLLELGECSILRVIATGRNLYSVGRVLPDDFPIDYLVFSTGAGIMNWKTKEIIRTNHLIEKEIIDVGTFLHREGYDFMIHKPIPDNHEFLYFKGERENPDFYGRIDRYDGFGRKGDIERLNLKKASQFLVIEPGNNHSRRYHAIKSNVNDVKVIRTTSPLDGKSIWIEIFSKDVSKALAGEYIARLHGIGIEHTFAVGNDFNDLDMLRWANTMYVVSNAAEEMKKEFPLVPTNNDSGFSYAVKEWYRKEWMV